MYNETVKEISTAKDVLRPAFSSVVSAMCKHDQLAYTDHSRIGGIFFTPSVVDTVLRENTNGSTERNLAYAQQAGDWFHSVITGDRLESLLNESQYKQVLHADLTKALQGVSGAYQRLVQKPSHLTRMAGAVVSGLLYEKSKPNTKLEKVAEHGSLSAEVYQALKDQAREAAFWFASLTQSEQVEKGSGPVVLFSH